MHRYIHKLECHNSFFTSEQRNRACDLMQKLGLTLSCISHFRDSDYIALFGDDLALSSSFVSEAVKSFESRSGCLVYTCICDTVWGFPRLSLLFASPYDEDWQYAFSSDGRTCRVYAYVLNLSDDALSESGSVYVQCCGGSLCCVG